MTGIGHEDDITVADLISDHRSATPTAAIVDLLPSRNIETKNFLQTKKMIKDYFKFFFQNKKNFLITKKSFFQSYSPQRLIKAKKTKINHIHQLLNALSPERLLRKGFALITDKLGNSIYSVKDVNAKDIFTVQFSDGKIIAQADTIKYDKI